MNDTTVSNAPETSTDNTVINSTATDNTVTDSVGNPAAHHIDVVNADTHIVVRIGGTVVADTTAAKVLIEGKIPPRYYIPQADVRMDLFTRTTSTTHCPFKGDASYWSVDVDGETHDDIVWSYPDPISAVADIAGLLSFYDERVELTVT